jgi:hypothetical protein
MAKKRALVIDFDDFFLSKQSSFELIDVIICEPKARVFEIVEKLTEYYNVHIHSFRSKQKNGRQAIKNWFTYHQRRDLLAKLTFPKEKPNRFITLRDVNINFERIQ